MHASTCSAITSAYIYSAVNAMDDDAVENWFETYKVLVNLPMMKFVMGAFCCANPSHLLTPPTACL